MKVKVGDKIYDGSVVPVMAILDDIDKRNISRMDRRSRCYCSYPEEMSIEDVKAFMKLEPNEIAIPGEKGEGK